MLLIFINKTPACTLARLKRLNHLPLTERPSHLEEFYILSWDQASMEKTAIEALEQLLAADYLPSLDDLKGQAWIVPRLGTISPWSSKATELIRQCGYPIHRIEHGYACHGLNLEAAWINQIMSMNYLYDPMTESLLTDTSHLEYLFKVNSPASLKTIPLIRVGKIALQEANEALGLALSIDEIDYLFDMYGALDRDPTDTELMMFAQANSEHCRHKIFNAELTVDGIKETESLFQKIKYTYQCHSHDILSAYHDNASIIRGFTAPYWIRDASRGYHFSEEPIHLLMKVETHNHPTAISPFAGAATGAGGELRDEGATGRGGRPKAGMVGFSVSDLLLPDGEQPWELSIGKPAQYASALDIMLEAPIGSASYNNEFGRPNIAGFFRTYCQRFKDQYRGYHKPIMVAGGYGNIREAHITKEPLPIGAQIIVLGGPAMEIGLGGGGASSKIVQENSSALDFASVQRGNPEMQRRCQEVIDHCLSLGDTNPILSIHDVGAGGLSNALPELIHDAKRGGHFFLRQIPNAEPGMSPLAIWCNEAQERYVIAINSDRILDFSAIAQRERCPFAIVGETKEEQRLIVEDSEFQNQPVNLPLAKLLGSMPPMKRSVHSFTSLGSPIKWESIHLSDAIQRVLQLPAVASKQCLITIGDRSVGGHVVRDQMVGRWQIPVSDVAVTTQSYIGFTGEAMAIGERPPIALINPSASARMAVGECLTNIAAADIHKLSDVKLSANWMAACGTAEDDGSLVEAVDALGKTFCPALGLTIPVGKDSLSMGVEWRAEGEEIAVKAPLSVVITGFAPVADVRLTLTPALQYTDSELYFIDLAGGKQRLGGSALLQVYQQLGDECPDVESTTILSTFFQCMQILKRERYISAYHDRSDGGLLTSLAEMSFASRIGWNIDITALGSEPIRSLFCEELGAIVEVPKDKKEKFLTCIKEHDLRCDCHYLGKTLENEALVITHKQSMIVNTTRANWQMIWSRVSYSLQTLRDNPACAKAEYETISQSTTKLFSRLTFIPEQTILANSSFKPRVAILREQGVNGHLEMAAAFHLAGFEAIDIHMTDILSGREDLTTMDGLVACGGFSYGDVLGAGRGWANMILYHSQARERFQAFFARPTTFTLGICNGCQMLSHLKSLIPGAKQFPTFIRNQSDQFEARLVMVEIPESNSLFFKGMTGSQLPIIVSHGEGQVSYSHNQNPEQITMRYIDSTSKKTETYPSNPNGSLQGITGVCSNDGRVTIMMPHPERMIRTVQFSWHPPDWEAMSPWYTIFCNAYRWVKKQHHHKGEL